MNVAMISILLALCALTCTTPVSAGTELGTLPPDEVARSTAGPSDELIGFLLFEPSLIAARVPPGVRLRRLEEKARDWPRLAAYLREHPERGGWAWSFFEIIGIHAASYDSKVARFDDGRGGMAVWYPELVRTDEADARPRGEQNLALGSWVSDARLVDYMRSRGFPATPARVNFGWDEQHARGDLETEGLSIHGECRLEGEPFVPRWGKDLHSFETMWTPAGEGDTFEIVTWSGHRSRHCRDAVWRVSGSHPFAQLFNDPARGDANFLPAEFAYGYDLRSSLYARKAPRATADNLYTRVDARLAADPALAERLGKAGPEMKSMSWLLGEWDVVAEVQAGTKTREPEHGLSKMVATLDGTLFEQRDSYPSGTQDLGFLGFSPATETWHTVALDSVGNAVVLEGKANDHGLLFEGDVTILGVRTHLRQTLEREGADAYLVRNEERVVDGRWILLDTYRYTRMTSAPSR